jgi:hypothetical protein
MGDKVVYRDKEKQQVAVREAVRRFRSKGITQGITEPSDVIPKPVIPVTPIIKTKADAVEAVQKISKDWRTPKVVGCRRFGENPEAA